MSEPVDVVIIGGGIAGAAVAYHLSPHREVMLLERESGLGYHASGRSAAELAPRFHPPIVRRLVEASFDFLTRPPEGFSDIGLLARRGNLLIAGREKKDRLAKVFSTESGQDSRLERLSVKQAIDRAPMLDPRFVADAFYDPDCWDIEADALLQGFARGARKSGASVRTGVEILGGRREHGLWIVATTAGNIHARVVVNAAGAWADDIGAVFGAGRLGIIPYRRTAIIVDAPGVDVERLPEICEIDEMFYFKPDAGRLMVSPADATESPPCDAVPDELDIAYAAHYLEQATSLRVQHVPHSWAGLRSFARDRSPVVGWSPQAEGFFWLAGQGGHGVQTSPALGELTARLILGKATERFGDLCLALAPARLGRPQTREPDSR